MADEVVGEAFVRIRPLVSASGFAAESEGAVAAAGTRLGAVFAAAFAAVGAAEIVKSTVKAAIDQQAAFAILERTVKNAGASTDIAGQSIQDLLDKESRLKGFSTIDLAAGFTRLVSVTHDSGKAFADLQKVEDLSRFSGQGLETGVLAISKVLQGSTTALQRQGIVVAKVTTEQDALKLAHERVLAAGAKLTEQDKELYAARLLQAKAIDTQATEEKALATIQERTGGVAATFANTPAGQFARLSQDVASFKVAVGSALLPTLTSAAEGLGAFLQKASDSPSVMSEAAAAAHSVSTAFHDTEDVVKALGPPLLYLVDKLGGVTHVVEILGSVLVANKFAAWISGSGKAAAAAVTDTAAVTGLTAALEANTAALAGNETAMAGTTAIYSTSGGVLATVATEEAAVAANAVTAAAEVGTLAGRLAGLAAIGAIAIAIDLIPKVTPSGPQSQRDANSILGQVPLFGHALQQINRVQSDVGNLLFGALPTGVRSDVVSPHLFPSLTGKSVADTLAGVTGGGVPLAKEFAAAAKRAQEEAKPSLLDTGKTGLNAIAQGIAGAQNSLQQAYLTAQQNALTAAGDQITLWYDTQTAKLLNRSQALQRQQSQLTLEQDLLSQAQAKKSLNDLRSEVLLPGGHVLPSNNAAALRQLDALEKRDKSPALEDFILQFRGAVLGVKQGALGIDQGKLGLQQEALDQQKTRETTALGLQQDSLKLAQDAQTARSNQLTEAKKQTALLKSINAETAQQKFVTSLERNPGAATKRQKQLAGVGR